MMNLPRHVFPGGREVGFVFTPVLWIYPLLPQVFPSYFMCMRKCGVYKRTDEKDAIRYLSQCSAPFNQRWLRANLKWTSQQSVVNYLSAQLVFHALLEWSVFPIPGSYSVRIRTALSVGSVVTMTMFLWNNKLPCVSVGLIFIKFVLGH